MNCHRHLKAGVVYAVNIFESEGRIAEATVIADVKAWRFGKRGSLARIGELVAERGIIEFEVIDKFPTPHVMLRIMA